MKDLGIWRPRARTIVLDYDAERAIDWFSRLYEQFDDIYRDIEGRLATSPTEIGIRGVVTDEIELGYYLHISERMPPISVLYRYDEDNVYVESLAVESQVRYGIAS